MTTYIERSHLLDKLLALSSRRGIWIIELLQGIPTISRNEPLGFRAAVMRAGSVWSEKKARRIWEDSRSSATELCWHVTKDHLHHGEMLQILVSLKESFSRVELDQDASN